MTIPSEAIPLDIAGNACGIYFLVHDGQVVYVGQSQHVRQRIANHKDKQFDSVYVLVAEHERLSALEDKWIRALQPPLNRRLQNSSVYPSAMIRINVHLPEDMRASLHELSCTTGVCTAEILRRAAVEYLAKQGA